MSDDEDLNLVSKSHQAINGHLPAAALCPCPSTCCRYDVAKRNLDHQIARACDDREPKDRRGQLAARPEYRAHRVRRTTGRHLSQRREVYHNLDGLILAIKCSVHFERIVRAEHRYYFKTVPGTFTSRTRGAMRESHRPQGSGPSARLNREPGYRDIMKRNVSTLSLRRKTDETG